MTFIVDNHTLRVMMNGFDSMVKPTIDVQQTDKQNTSQVGKVGVISAMGKRGTF